MKIGILLLSLFGVAALNAAPASKKDATFNVELPTFVVIGFRIPPSWLEVSCECDGPLPYNRIKRAWISKVGHDTPADKVGIKVGDTLLAIGHEATGAMTGVSLHDNLRRERDPGTRLELTIQTPGSAQRTVVIVFK